ncbi:unnamed protein product, partial [Rotaria magnacalcarata]
RIQQSLMTTAQLSPASSSGFSPLMVASFNENLDTQSTGFDADRKSYTSTGKIFKVHNNTSFREKQPTTQTSSRKKTK